MSVTITERELKEALVELEEMRQKKVKPSPWTDELYNLVLKVRGNPLSRKQDKISFEELTVFLNKKGWWKGSKKALQQSFSRERIRRQGLVH